MDELVDDGVRLQIDTLCLANAQQALLLGVEANGSEAELDAARGQWVDNLADVIANDAEARCGAVRLNNTSKGCLRIDRHRVCLVEDHKLELGDVATVGVSGDFALGKLLDLLSDNGDAALITSVQLKNSLAVEIGAEQVFGER